MAELLTKLTGRELAEWMAYERIYGTLGPARDDHLAALISSTIASAFSDKGKAPSVADFMPPWDEREVGDGNGS